MPKGTPLPPMPAAGSAQNPWLDMSAAGKGGKPSQDDVGGKGAGKGGGKGPRDAGLRLHEIPVMLDAADPTNKFGCVIGQALYYSMGRN